MKLLLIFLFALTLPFQALATECDIIREQIISLEDKTELQFVMLERALSVARIEMDRRLEGMNEVRAQLNAQTRTFMTRAEIEQVFLRIKDNQDRLLEKIASIESLSSRASGEDKWKDHIVTVLIGLGVLLTISYITRRNNKQGNKKP